MMRCAPITQHAQNARMIALDADLDAIIDDINVVLDVLKTKNAKNAIKAYVQPETQRHLCQLLCANHSARLQLARGTLAAVAMTACPKIGVMQAGNDGPIAV